MIGFGCGEVVQLDDVPQDRAHRDEARRARFMRLAAGRMPTAPPLLTPARAVPAGLVDDASEAILKGQRKL